MSLSRASSSSSSSFLHPPSYPSLFAKYKYIRYIQHDTSSSSFNQSQSPKLALSRIDIEHIKHPSRGGQNLSNRYLRLEKSLRGKQAQALSNINIIHDSETLDVDGSQTSAGTSGSSDTSETFRGLTIPREPKPPESDECCMSGCAACVYDLYEESLASYKESLASLRSTLLASNIPESEWPSSLQTGTRTNVNVNKGPVLSAFEELERKLKEKHEQDSTKTGNRLLHDRSSRPGSRSRSKFRNLVDLRSIYEGIQWIIFSNR